MSKALYEMKERVLDRIYRHDLDPQTELLNALLQNNLKGFKKLLLSNKVRSDHCYDCLDYKTCLDIACSNLGYSEFVKLLLEQQVDVNKFNKVHKKAPIQFAAEAGDLKTVRVLLKEPNIEINATSQGEDNETYRRGSIRFAAETGDSETVQMLLEDSNIEVSKTYKSGSMHFADEAGNTETIRVPLEDPNIEVNATSKGNTALHLAIKRIESVNDDRKRINQYEEIVELLLKAKSDVNIPDLKGLTPIYSAAKQGLERIVQLIIEYSKNPDLDSYKDENQNSARTIIEQSFSYLLESLLILELFSHLRNYDEKRFIEDFKEIIKNHDLPNILSNNNCSVTLLQISCANGLDEAAKILLENGADPNLTASGGSMRPVVLACSKGYHKVLTLLAANESTSFEPVNGDSLLQIVIKEARHKIIGDPKTDYKKCLHILLESPTANTDVNHLDNKENTALHYATRSGDQETVKALLKKGACIGLTNKLNEPPLVHMSAKTLESYLDECLTANSERRNDEDYEIQFNYSCLKLPSNISRYEVTLPVNDSVIPISANDRFLAHETDALLYMTQCSELKPLLKHPVITSFLYLKWHRISYLFYANITFYTMFYLSLILYILLGYGGPTEKSRSANANKILTITGWFLLIVREVSQIVVSYKVYFKSIRNWLEICLIAITAIIVFNDTTSEDSKQQLSAVTILLASAVFVLLIGQFPSLSTNIVMLKTVSWNFFKFLLWYCILIIAFSLSFYTLFKTVEKHDLIDESVLFDSNKDTGAVNEKPNFFLNPGISLLKTIVMLTGEFEVGSINFEAFPVTSRIIFVIFVFMIPIVLFNLLNGLAVSDTQAIKADAELLGHISRIKFISYFESVILGDTSPYKTAISNTFCWPPSARSGLNCVKPLARRVCLFPNFLPMARIGVKVNQMSRVVVYTSERPRKNQGTDDDNPQLIWSCLAKCTETIMDGKIVKDAKFLIAEREEGGNEIRQIKDKLISCEKKLDSFEKLLQEGGNEMKQIKDTLVTYEKKNENFEKLLQDIYKSVKK